MNDEEKNEELSREEQHTEEHDHDDRKHKRNHRSIDMTKGPIVGPLFQFIWPIIFSSLFQQLYNTVDFLYVGNFLDKTAAAAVGASSTLITCIIGLFTGISVGTSVIAGQAIGARTPSGPARRCTPPSPSAWWAA